MLRSNTFIHSIISVFLCAGLLPQLLMAQELELKQIGLDGVKPLEGVEFKEQSERSEQDKIPRKKKSKEKAAKKEPSPAKQPPQKNSRKRRRSKRSQVAIVAVEGATVYKFPNFDSPIVEYLKAGTKVLASIKPKQGIGGFGSFYKVKLPNKKLGWMTDVDIFPQYKSDGKGKAKKQENPDFEKAKDVMENAEREPVYFEKYIGLNTGFVQFSEKFDKKNLSSDVTVFGVRAIGPGVLFDGPPLDMSLSFSFEAPEYYRELSNEGATGFFVLGDILFPFPFISGDSYALTLGMGASLVYTNFDVRVRTSDFDSQELRLGAAGSLGFTYRFGKIAVRLDGKYYYEVTEYAGANLSILVNIPE